MSEIKTEKELKELLKRLYVKTKNKELISQKSAEINFEETYNQTSLLTLVDNTALDCFLHKINDEDVGLLQDAMYRCRFVDGSLYGQFFSEGLD